MTKQRDRIFLFSLAVVITCMISTGCTATAKASSQCTQMGYHDYETDWAACMDRLGFCHDPSRCNAIDGCWHKKPCPTDSR